MKHKRALVGQAQLDFQSIAERRRVQPGPPGGQALRRGQAQPIEQGGKQNQPIPDEHAVGQARNVEGGNQPQKPSGKQ